MKRICLLFLLVLSNLIHGQENSRIPEILLQELDGQEVSTTSYFDGKAPVVFDFWATWCKPCLIKYETLKKLLPAWEKETGVRVIAVSIDAPERLQEVRELVGQSDWPLEVLLDPNQELFRRLNQGKNSVPRAFFFNNRGVLTAISAGVRLTTTPGEDLLTKMKEASPGELEADLQDYYQKIKAAGTAKSE